MTYALLALLFLGVAAVTSLGAALTVGLPLPWWRTTLTVSVVLLLLTTVFDSAMIALDLFRYDTGSLLGPRIVLVPIEDFAWPVAAALALPALWELLGRTRGRDAVPRSDVPEVVDLDTPRAGDRDRTGAPSREH